MRAALVSEIGEPPALGGAEEPEGGGGRALLEVLAAPVNPIDVAIANGSFYSGAPPTPYTAGKDGVGRVIRAEGLTPGSRVYFTTPGGLGGTEGAMAERAACAEEDLFPVPDGIDAELAACFGIAGLAAWLTLEWRAKLEEGETVLVLGASGALGTIAVQAAKLLGAGRVVAAARDSDGLERARRLGADATVDLSQGGDLAAAFRGAAEGEIDVTVDPLWGPPAVAAADASARFGRLVQIGQSAGAEATLTSSSIRGKMLSILGHTSNLAPREVRAAAYAQMVGHAAAGRLKVEHESYPLERVGEMWERQTGFPYRKLMVVP